MADDDAGTEGAEEGGEKKGGALKWIIIGVVVLIVLAGIGVGVFFALSGSKDGDSGDDADEEELGDEEDAGGDLPGAVFPLEVFIVNLGVKGSFLKVSIQLEFFDPEPPPGIESSVPKLRDAIIRVISAKTAADILNIDGKEKLRKEVINTVNDALGGEDVMQVYFTEFIVQ